MAFTCPICTYPKLSEQPRSEFGGGSYEICPSCGFQFGVDDDDEGYTYETWGKKWIAAGRRWCSKGIARPKGWPPPLKETPAPAVAPAEKKGVKVEIASSIEKKSETRKTPANAKPLTEPVSAVKGAKPAKPAVKTSAKPAGKTKVKTPAKPAKKPAAKGPTKKSAKK